MNEKDRGSGEKVLPAFQWKVLELTPLEQYGLLLLLVFGVILLVVALHLIARGIGTTLKEGGKDLPFSGGTLDRKPAWVRYHIHYYGLALLFLAFDMEMAFMYPWAVVYRELGVPALVDMGVFLAILFLGIVYAWREGAIRWQ